MMRVNRNKKTMMKKTPKRLGVAVNPSVAFMDQDGVKKNSAGKDGAQGIWQINRKGGRQKRRRERTRKRKRMSAGKESNQKSRSFPPRPDDKPVLSISIIISKDKFI